MKNNLAKTLSILSFLCLSSCGSSAKAVEIFIYDSQDTFIGSLNTYLQADLNRGSISFDSVYYAERKQTTQNEQVIEALGKDGVKLLILNMVDRLAASALIEKAESKNVPIIFINREPLASDLSTTWSSQNCVWVGSDPAVEGQLQAEIASEFFGGADGFKNSIYDKNKDGKIQVVVLKGEQGHQDAEQRSRYCISDLKDKGFDVDILSTAYCNWETATAREAMKSLYSDKIELLFSNNDDMALGAIQFLQQDLNAPSNESTSSSSSLSSSSLNESSDSSSPTPEIPFAQRYFPIIGVDDTAKGQAAIQDGTLTGTVLNDAKKQSNLIYALTRKYLLNQSLFYLAPTEYKVENNFYYVIGRKITKTV
jgi:methyl-galactoside transport system substrate-binding protein